MAVIVYSLSSLLEQNQGGVVEQLELEPTVGCGGIGNGNGWG